jgi:uncharacterized protein YeaO (DUF488 family)
MIQLERVYDGGPHAPGVRFLVERLWPGRVTLLFSSRDTTHNNAVALKEYLDGKLRRPARRKPTGRPSTRH